jgi:hypothetical protein
MLAATATLIMTGCDKNDPTVDYCVVLEVKNDTDREIVLTNSTAVNARNMSVTIGPGASGSTVCKLYSGPAAQDSPLEDHFEDDDVLPFGDATLSQLPEGGYWVNMTLGGAAVDGKVWTRKHWTFRADGRNRVYSLTVTGEFIDGFITKLEPSPDPDKGQVTLYDKDKKAAAYVDYDDEATVYTWDGRPAAYLVRPEKGEEEDGIMVYGFNGKFLGWYASGVMHGTDGRVAGAKKWIKIGEFSTVVVTESPRGIKHVKPVKYVEEVPFIFHEPIYGWSETSLADFLGAGMVK